MTKHNVDFGANKALKALLAGQDLNGKDGIFTPLIKQLTEAALKTELEQHLNDDPGANCKSGATSKTVKTASGDFELDKHRGLH